MRLFCLVWESLYKSFVCFIFKIVQLPGLCQMLILVTQCKKMHSCRNATRVLFPGAPTGNTHCPFNLNNHTRTALNTLRGLNTRLEKKTEEY